MLNSKFHKPNWLKNEYDFALDQYREIKSQRDKLLDCLSVCYEALGKGAVHGKKEQSMLVKIKTLNGALFIVSVDLAKAEIKLNKSARSKF